MSIQGQQNVVQFKIPVRCLACDWQGVRRSIPIDDTLRMEVLEGQQYLRRIEFSLSQRKLLSLDVKHQITTADVLHNKVNPSFRLETRM